MVPIATAIFIFLIITTVAVATAATDNISPFQICTCESDATAVHYASSKLSIWLKNYLCNSIQFNRINISSESISSIPTSCLAVGPCASKAVHFNFPLLTESQEGDGEETFAIGFPSIETTTFNNYAITGIPSSTKQRGTIYAAVSFIENFGVRFLTSNFTLPGTECPSKWLNASSKTVFNIETLPELYRFNPPLEYRQVLQWDFNEHSDFAMAVGINSPGNSLVGGGVNYASPPGFVHTSSNLVNRSALFATHPEWFWPRDNHSIGQLCWSNESLVEYVVNQVITMLKNQPDASVVSVSQNDNFDYCNSTAEQAIYKEEGGVGIGPILRAVNKVALAIKDKYPNVKVDTLAYQWTRGTPLITKPLDNVVIRLCSIECDFGSKLSDPSNAKFQKDIVDWSKISDRTWIWNYVTDFANYVMPWPDWYNIDPNTKFYYKHSGKGVFQESSYQSYGGDMAPLKGYLMAKTLFNPDLDGQAIIDEFLLGYYGPAAEQFQQYLNLWSNQVKDTNMYLGESVPYTSKYLSPRAIVESGNLLKEAESLVREAKDDVRLLHVQEGSLSTLYVALLRWKNIQMYANENPNIPWPFEKTLELTFDKFYTIYNATDVTHLSESGNDIEWLKKELNLG